MNTTISVIATISDPTIHGIWLPLGQLIEHLGAKSPMEMTFNLLETKLGITSIMCRTHTNHRKQMRLRYPMKKGDSF